MNDTPFAICVQALGTLMVAALLWQLTRIIPGLFLKYWAIGWIGLTVALFALKITQPGLLPEKWRPAGLIIYSLGEFLYGFLLWGGFRNYMTGQALALRDTRVFLVIIPVSLVTPWALDDDLVLPVHTLFVAAFFTAAFWVTLPLGPKRSVGFNIVRVMLASLAVIFFCYGPLLIWSRRFEIEGLQYLRLSPIYDALIELGLAFGIVVLATERAHENLEAKNRELAEASRRDALTGLFNRRHFDEIMEGLKGKPAGGTIAVIDVNDLKRINDNHLHAAGDAALKLVARSLVSRFRVTDPIFRLGGDEFAVVMPTGSEADLVMRMADVDDSLMNLRLPGVPEPTDVRVAWGVASYDTGDDLPMAFHIADKAMYACKQRRKTVAHDPE